VQFWYALCVFNEYDCQIPVFLKSRKRNFLCARSDLLAESCADFPIKFEARPRCTFEAGINTRLIPDRYFESRFSAANTWLSQLQSLTVGCDNFGRTSFGDSVRAHDSWDLPRESLGENNAGFFLSFFLFGRFNACSTGQ